MDSSQILLLCRTLQRFLEFPFVSVLTVSACAGGQPAGTGVVAMAARLHNQISVARTTQTDDDQRQHEADTAARGKLVLTLPSSLAYSNQFLLPYWNII